MTTRRPRRTLVGGLASLALVTLVALVQPGCTSPEEHLARAEAALQQGDYDVAEQALRAGLEAYPDDVPLLLFGVDLYLRTMPENLWRPRFALHYAMRADKAAGFQSKPAAEALMRAYRASGGFEEADELRRRGLARIGHPDAAAPRSLEPADPDLLELTGANLREQRRRRKAEAEAEAASCGLDWMGKVSAGSWPVGPPGPDGVPGDVDLGPFCIGRFRDRQPPRLATSEDIGDACRAQLLEPCSQAQLRVACGPMKGVLGDHPACADPLVLRCCASVIAP